MHLTGSADDRMSVVATVRDTSQVLLLSHLRYRRSGPLWDDGGHRHPGARGPRRRRCSSWARAWQEGPSTARPVRAGAAWNDRGGRACSRILRTRALGEGVDEADRLRTCQGLQDAGEFEDLVDDASWSADEEVVAGSVGGSEAG